MLECKNVHKKINYFDPNQNICNGYLKELFHERLLLTHYLLEIPFNTFANRTDPDQAALELVRMVNSPNHTFFLGKLD